MQVDRAEAARCMAKHQLGLLVLIRFVDNSEPRAGRAG